MGEAREGKGRTVQICFECLDPSLEPLVHGVGHDTLLRRRRRGTSRVGGRVDGRSDARWGRAWRWTTRLYGASHDRGGEGWGYGVTDGVDPKSAPTRQLPCTWEALQHSGLSNAEASDRGTVGVAPCKRVGRRDSECLLMYGAYAVRAVPVAGVGLDVRRW